MRNRSNRRCGPDGNRGRGQFIVMAVLTGALLYGMAGLAATSQPRAEPAAGRGIEGELPFGLALIDQGEAAQAWQARLLASYAAVEIFGAVARVRIRQIFLNDGGAVVDGRYLFPLPESSAVDRLTVRFGETRIEGILKEKAEARQTFERARSAGKRAGLVEALRPNIFSTDLANIAGGELVSVDLEYQLAIKPRDGVFELRLPQIITPRFVPTKHVAAGDGIDWRRLMEILAENGAVMETNDPNSPFGFPAAFAVNLQAGGDIASIESPSHALAVRNTAPGSAEIALRDRFVPADRDFVLRWQLAAGAAPNAMLFHEPWNGAHYYMAMVSPARAEAAAAPPRDVRIVIDTSGSMEGPSLEQAKAALQQALNGLRPADRFEIIRFSDKPMPLFGESKPVSDRSVAEARRFVAGLAANGGTNMAPALLTALAVPGGAESVRQVVFLTDGAVSNEAALFQLTHENLGAARLFTVGLGPAPNAWFMRKAAEAGRGFFTNIDRVEESGQAVAALYRKLGAAQMTDLATAFQAADGDSTPDAEMYPQMLPDLYAGEPLYFVIRTDHAVGALKLKGRLNGEAWTKTLDGDDAVVASGIAKLWAREKLEHLDDMRRLGADTQAIRAAALPVALGHGIAGRYTSFVAVEEAGPPTRSGGSDGPPAGLQKAGLREAAVTNAAFQVRGPATASGWKQDLLIGLLLALVAAGLLWWAHRHRARAV